MAKATNKESAKEQKDSKAASSKKDSKKKAQEEQVSGPAQLQQFVKDSWSEFQKIQWPTPRQATNESVIVLLTVVFVIALVNLYDFVSNFVLSFILTK